MFYPIQTSRQVLHNEIELLYMENNSIIYERKKLTPKTHGYHMPS